MSTLVTGSHGCIGAWVLKTLLDTDERPIAYDRIGEACPGRKLEITHDAATTVPVTGTFDDAGCQRTLGSLSATPLRDGVRRTIETFERWLRAGRPDARALS